MKSFPAALAAAFLLAPWPAAHSETTCPGGVCEAQTLVPFLRVLDSARTRPVHILQIGDSHTANENFAGAWRDILQARYGDGGRGVLPPGRPWAGYVTRQVTVGQSADWSGISVMGAHKAGRTDVVFGAAGFRLSAPPTGGELRLQADDGHSFRRFVVCVATGPAAGTLTLTLGAQFTVVPLEAPQEGVACPELTSEAPQIVAGAAAVGSVDILSWASFTDRPGVVVSNLGVPGSQLLHMALNGDAGLAAELKAYAPDLIVIAYGTNEGFGPNFSSADYEATLRGAIRRMRRLAPGAPLLLLGAPDAQSHSRILLHNSDQGHRASVGVDGWFSPPALEDVRAIQRRVSASEHVALWDWADRMGGVGAADSWPRTAPPLMRADHVHYTVQGGLRLAQRLQADLDAICTAACTPGQGD